MNSRFVSLGTMVLALISLNSTMIVAKDVEAPTHDGKVVSITSSKLVMTSRNCNEVKEHSHTLAANTKMTLDGKACTADHLKPGMKIRVTTKVGNMSAATQIEAIDKDLLFANTHEGKVVSITSSKLVISDKGGTERSFTVSIETKVSCDGKACKTSDLKTGMKVRVSTLNSDVGATNEIEAIDKEAEFASL